MCGDIYFKIVHKGALKNSMICRFALNTSFIKENYYEFNKANVDPDSVVKDIRISTDFKVECYFRDVCKICNPTMPLEMLCSMCMKNMASEIDSWKIIRKILDVILNT